MSFLRAATRPAGCDWSVEQAATFAARRDFELLVLLSNRRVVAMARRMGVPLDLHERRNAQPVQQGAVPAGGGQHDDNTVPARATRRRPRKVSAARRHVLDERFEQKRLVWIKRVGHM